MTQHETPAGDTPAGAGAPEATGAGDCYEAAAKALMDIALFEPEQAARVTICHGEHGAWLEMQMGDTVMVLDPSRRLAMVRDAYYELGRIDPAEVRRYTWEQARAAMIACEHYGPWYGSTS